MRAVVRGLFCLDVEDLERWSPDDSEFGLVLDLQVGPSNDVGGEVFHITVCTPRWFESNLMDEGRARSGIHTIFMRQWDYRVLRSFIERALASAEGETWQEVTSKLSWLGHWEFADFRPV